MEDELWTTLEGKTLTVGEMTEEHAKNVLRMILRNRRRKAADTVVLKAESNTLGSWVDLDREAYTAVHGRDEWGDA